MSTEETILRPVASPATLPLLAELLAEQQRLQTPVARFSEAHSLRGTPDLRSYRDLIPLSAPAPGEQYAFEVDLDRCTGCKACVAGCHSLNGLDEGETWRDVGLLVGPEAGAPYQQTLTTACHHCADPGCLNGCPVLAYEKDPVTGIVSHLDDQCIGCQYCVLKCPYDVPKYNARLGIVRKCDLCQQRLSAGEAPACVQACPTEAIRIVKVAAGTASAHFPSAAPSPVLTAPTTRYVSKSPIPEGARPADETALRPQPAHWPLVILLVATQAGVGLLGAALKPGPHTIELLVGASLFAIGLAASVAHLGQPLRAWRVFLNLRRSWLSREAVVLGAAAGPFAGTAACALGLLPSVHLPLLMAATAVLGSFGVFCSAMIYIDTGRSTWNAARTGVRFGGTLAVAAVGAWDLRAGAVLLALKIGLEFLDLGSGGNQRQRELLIDSRAVGLRIAGGALAIAGAWAGVGAPSLLFFVGGELAERYLYFRTVRAPKMPGGAGT